MADPLRRRRLILLLLFCFMLISFQDKGIGGFATYWGLAVALSLLALFLEEHAHFSRTAVGFLVGLPSATAIVLVLVAGCVSQRLLEAGRSRWLAQGVIGAIALLLSAVAMVVQTRTGGGTPLVIAMAVAFSAANVLTPLAGVASAGDPGAGFQPAFDVAGVIALAGAAVVFVLMRTDRDASRLRPAAPRDDEMAIATA